MADEQYKLPSPSDLWKTKREQWARKLEGALQPSEPPIESEAAPPAYTTAPSNWLDYVVNRALRPLSEVISGISALWRGRVTEPGPYAYPTVPEEVAQQAKDEAYASLNAQAGALTMLHLYDTLPMVQYTGVTSFDEYQETFGLNTQYLSPQELQEARSAVEAAIQERGAPKEEGELPDWLEVSPEERAQVEQFIRQPETKRAPLSLSTMSVEEVRKALHATPRANLPPDMTMEEMLQLMSVMGLSDEAIGQAVDMTEATKIFRDAALEQAQKIEEVKQGLDEWEVPDRTFWEKAMFAVQSPLQQFANFLRPYLENVNYPMAGLAEQMVADILGGTQEIELLYDAKRAQGLSPWEAAKETHMEWDAPWYQKIIAELVTDPLSYVGTPVLRGVGTLLTKVGLGSLGRGVIAFNKGFYIATDIPFDLMKAGLRKLPKTTNQTVKAGVDQFNSYLWAAVELDTGKVMSKVTPEELAATMHKAVEFYSTHPHLAGNDIRAKLGQMLTEHAALSGRKIWSWSQTYGGMVSREFAPDAVPNQLVAEVNDILSRTTSGMVRPQEGAALLAHSLGIEKTAANMSRLTKEIPRFTKSLATDVDTALSVAKRASYNKVHKMVEYLNHRQKAVIMSHVDGPRAAGSTFEGMLLGLQRRVSALENHRIRKAIDRWVVRPFAEAYLGSIAYPLWNAFEGIAVSIIEGVIPRRVRAENYFMMTKGLIGDPQLADRLASDVAGILGGAPHRRGGAWTFFPRARIPERIGGVAVPKFLSGRELFGWMGRYWIDLSNKWGNVVRQNFVMQRMATHLSELAYREAGGDVMKGLERVIKHGAPDFDRKVLGLTRNQLEQELWYRATVSSRDMRALKTLLTNGELQKAEALKLVRETDTLSPRAKTLAESLIEEEEILRSEETIERFAQKITETTLEDIKRLPFDIGQSFQELANTLAETPINTADELAEVFTSYEVMSQTASFIPHRIMSQTMEEADELYKRGAFRNLDKLWRTRREEMLQAMEEISGSMEQVRDAIRLHENLLSPEALNAMEEVLRLAGDADALRQATLQADAQLLDTFWKLPRTDRTADAYAALRAERDTLWSRYRRDSANIGANEFVARRELSKIYHNLPEPKLQPVDATSRPLTVQDCAKVFGVNADGLCSGLINNLSLHGKEYFVELVQRAAESKPHLFKGFTPSKIETVYDDILRQAFMRPDKDIEVQKVLLQGENLRQSLLNLKMCHSISPEEEARLARWIDAAADMRDNLIVRGKGKKGQLTQARWDELRQEALNRALKDYYKSFADYSNENIIAGTMKMIFPYWTYHTYRWFYLLRSGIRHPGLVTGWGKYQNYGQYGYQPSPIPDLEFNPFVGSVAGTTFVLTRFDYKSYYENLGYFGEMLDYTQRFGFYPGAHVMLPIVMTPYLSGEKIAASELLPPIATATLDVIIASPNEKVAKAGQYLKDKIFHERFHDYYASTILTSKQVEAGGTLIGGQSGAEIWMKIQRGEALTPEEQKLWDESYRKAAKYGILRSQFPQFRLRTEEYKDAYDAVTQIFKEEYGMSEEFQKELWRQHLRPSDIVGGDSPKVKAALDELWQWKAFFGRSTVLMPPEVAHLKTLQDQYYKRVESFQQERLEAQAAADSAFLNPTGENHLNGKEWREAYGANWNGYVTKVESLESDPQFADAIEAMTPEGQARLAERLGFIVPPTHPLEEALRLYYNVELKKTTDPYTGEIYDDYQTFWAEREAIRMALTDEQREEFDGWINRYKTPMEKLWKYAYNTYIRGYRATNKLVFDTYEEDQKALIREYYSDLTTSSRREEIRQVINPATGRKLISEYETSTSEVRQMLRTASPELDFWLLTFGYVTKPRTEQARIAYQAFEENRTQFLEQISDWNEQEVLTPPQPDEATMKTVEAGIEYTRHNLDEEALKPLPLPPSNTIRDLVSFDLEEPPTETISVGDFRYPKQFLAGIGGIFKSLGGALSATGMNDLGLTEFGSGIQESALQGLAPATTWPQKIADAAFQSAPFIIGAVGIAVGGMAAAGALGLGTIGTWLVGSVLGTAASRPIESVIEAGAAYNEAIEGGLTKDQADHVFHEVLEGNLRLAGWDATQIAVAFMPTPAKAATSPVLRTLKIGSSVIFSGLSEGGEEVYQEIITKKALGDDYYWHPEKWDDDQKLAFFVGTLMGGGMQAGGMLFSPKSTTLGKSSDEGSLILAGNFMREADPKSFDDAFRAAKAKGKSDSQASMDALFQSMDKAANLAMEVSSKLSKIDPDLAKHAIPATEADTITDYIESPQVAALRSGMSETGRTLFNVMAATSNLAQSLATNEIGHARESMAELVKMLDYIHTWERPVPRQEREVLMGFCKLLRQSHQRTQESVLLQATKVLDGLCTGVGTSSPMGRSLLLDGAQRSLDSLRGELETTPRPRASLTSRWKDFAKLNFTTLEEIEWVRDTLAKLESAGYQVDEIAHRLDRIESFLRKDLSEWGHTKKSANKAQRNRAIRAERNKMLDALLNAKRKTHVGHSHPATWFNGWQRMGATMQLNRSTEKGGPTNYSMMRTSLDAVSNEFFVESAREALDKLYATESQYTQGKVDAAEYEKAYAAFRKAMQDIRRRPADMLEEFSKRFSVQFSATETKDSIRRLTEKAHTDFVELMRFVPVWHLQEIEHIFYNSSKGGQTVEGYSRAIGDAWLGSGVVRCYSKGDYDTLAHEIGHQVHYAMMHGETPPWNATARSVELCKAIYELYKTCKASNTGFIWNYGKRNVREFFATSYEAYIKEQRQSESTFTDPFRPPEKRLSQINPGMYSLLDTIFHDESIFIGPPVRLTAKKAGWLWG